MARFLFWRGSHQVDGTAYYRTQLMAQAVAWCGHQAGAAAQLLDHQFDVDVLVAARTATQAGCDRLRWVRKTFPKCKIFIDLDDDYFNIDQSNANARKFWTDEMLNGLRISMALADGVTAVSERLAERLRMYTKTPVYAIENALHAGILAHTRSYDPDRLVVGWAGSENTAAWLPMILNAVNNAAKGRYGPPPYITFIGVSPYRVAELGFRWTRGNGNVIEWIPQFSDYFGAMSKIDILLAPYRRTPFTEVKFPTKALEAAFLGIPLLASAIPPYEDWITHGENGYLIRYEHEWGKHLEELLGDAALRREIGLNASDRAALNTLQTAGERWEEVCLD